MSERVSHGQHGSAGSARRGVEKDGRCASAFEPERGWRSKEIEDELPQLQLTLVRLRLAELGAVRGRALSESSPTSVLARLRELSNRFRGARAVAVRREPIPAAYRVFYHQIGLDPDLIHTPIEAAVLERMLRGGFLSGGLLQDVLLIALVDTGVPVWALDATAVDGALGLRVSEEGEPLGRSAGAQVLPAGRLVVADDAAALGLLFGELAPGAQPGSATRELTLFAVQVPGVPSLYVEEALWICHESLERAA